MNIILFLEKSFSFFGSKIYLLYLLFLEKSLSFFCSKIYIFYLLFLEKSFSCFVRKLRNKNLGFFFVEVEEIQRKGNSVLLSLGVKLQFARA